MTKKDLTFIKAYSEIAGFMFMNTTISSLNRIYNIFKDYFKDKTTTDKMFDVYKNVILASYNRGISQAVIKDIHNDMNKDADSNVFEIMARHGAINIIDIFDNLKM